MKARPSILLLLIQLIYFAQPALAQSQVALIVDNTSSLTGRENAVKTLIVDLGYSVALKSYSEATYNNLTGYLFTVATDNGAISAEAIDSLITNGNDIALLYDAGAPVGGTWNYSSTSSYRNAIVENSQAFLEGYESNLGFTMQSSDYTWYVSIGYPSGWTILGRNQNNEAYKTAFSREHTSSGRGAILTYDPLYYTGSGENILTKVCEWLTGTPPLPGVTVPTDNVAFVITGSDDTTPTLTDRETTVRGLLESQGYSLTYIRFSRLSNSDLSGARFVIGAEYPSLDANTVDDLITGGQGVALLYDAGVPVGGTWYQNNGSYDLNMVVGTGQAFLEGYASDVAFKIQSNYSAWSMSSGYPYGWTILGKNTRSDTYKTAFSREHASGGRGAILTYNPQYYTGAGENIFAMIAGWLTGTPPLPGVTVPVGNVAFVITGSDDTTPNLTSREAAVRDQLASLGYSLTYIRFSRLSNSDLSGARFVIGAEYPSLDANTVDDLITGGQGVALLYGAGAPVGGSWNYAGSSYYKNAIVENGQAFLEGYESNLGFTMQSSGYALYISSGYPPSWTILGKNWSNDAYKTAFAREHASGGRGTILTYDPQYYTGAGENIWLLIIDWIADATISTAISIPEGNVALISRGSLALPTDIEQALRDRLLTLGYQVTYVPFGRLNDTDLSPAKFVIAAQYPSIDSITAMQLLRDGKGVGLLYAAGAPIGGTWDLSSSSYYRNLFIESNTAFLENYVAGASIPIQSSSYAAYVSENYPGLWTSIGRHTQNTAYKTSFYHVGPGGGRGAMFTYNPRYFTADGDTALKRIALWISTRSPFLSISSGEVGHTFGNVLEGNNPSLNQYTFTVQNTGGSALSGSISTSAGWVSVSTTSFSLDSSQTQQITVSANTTSLSPGNYTATVSVTSNGGNASGNATVRMVLGPQLAIAGGSLAHDFGTVPEGANPDTSSYTITVQNSGGDTLVGTISVSEAWVSVSATAFSLLAGASSQITVSATTSDLVPGYHLATLSIASNGGNASGKVEARIPHLVLLADSIGYDFGTVETGNDPDSTYSFSVQNSGAGILTCTVSSSESWAAVTPTSFSLDSSQTQQITVSANTTSLSPGNYTATVSVTSNGGNASGNATVSMVLGPQLAIAGGSLAHDFGTVPEGANPDTSSYTITVQNSGGDTLVGTISVSEAWVSVSATAFSLLAGANLQITVSATTSDLVPGYHLATLSIASNGGNASGKVQARIPHLSLLADSIGYNSGMVETGNDPDSTYSFSVQNSGAGILTCTVSSSESWAAVTPTSFSLDSSQTQQITVSANTTSLNLGNYMATVSLSSDSGNDSGFVHIEITPPLAISPETGVPNNYSLHPSYPNPFNPSTTLRFDLPVASAVTLVIYDVLGREVVRLADSNFQPGYHQLVWWSTDAAERDVPSGLYIARLVTPDYTKSIKMLLLK